MNAFEDEIQRVKQEAQAFSVAAVQNEQNGEMQTAVQQQLFTLLFEFANRACASDSDLDVTVSAGSKPKLVAGFRDSNFATPRYTLTSKWIDKKVELTVSDGNWTEAANYIGLWGSWADAKVVYFGTFVDSPIREAVERTFLAWYQSVKTNRMSGTKMQ